jgi:hypothetical protein
MTPEPASDSDLHRDLHRDVHRDVHRDLHRDRGSGSVLGLAVLGAVVGATLVTIPLMNAFAARQAVSGAADAAALAAADTRAGVVSGYPCEIAEAIAQLNKARLVLCELDGLIATVAVSRTILGVEVVVFATAGPPASAGPMR